MVVSITLFLGIFFPLVEFYAVTIVLFFAVRILGTPLKLFWNAIFALK